MPKSLVFYNDSWVRNLAPLKFSECVKLSMNDLINTFHATQYCTNSETYMMTDCFIRNFDAEWVYPNNLEQMRNSPAPSIVVNGLHCLSHKCGIDRAYWQSILDLGKKVVPMPLGFWYLGGYDRLTPDMEYIIKQIAERNEIGVRGEFAADILEKAGIKNVRILGDVSMFYGNNRNTKVEKRTDKIRSVNCDFTNYYPFQFDPNTHFCKYFLPVFKYYVSLYKNTDIKVDYTIPQSLLEDIANYADLMDFAEVEAFLMDCGRYFFSAQDWINAIKENDFSLCTRFHGGVASIFAGTPALLVCLDRRMEELMRVSKIPFIMPQEFDPSKPIEYYYELADYTEFNNSYAAWYDNFIEYCRVNEVSVKAPCAAES